MISRIFAVVALVFVIYGVSRFQSYYFNRSDVIARRAARAKMPGWLNSLESLTWLSLYLLLIFGLIWIIGRVNDALHPGTYTPGLALAPVVIAALPLAMLLSNGIFWAIPYTRRIENHHTQGVPGASFSEANIGLVKFALILEPVCLLVIAYGLNLL
jgi:hypothetical protein